MGPIKGEGVIGRPSMAERGREAHDGCHDFVRKSVNTLTLMTLDEGG